MSILKIKDSQGNWVGVPTVKGDTGNGISSAVLNNDYTLTLTFTNGTTYTTPSIRGEKGEKGEPATDMEIHICSASEYDAETRIPTIANPNDKTFYLVPTEDGTSPDLFTEWVYVDGAWEMFGSASIDLTDYVKNTDYATGAKAGVIKLNPNYGINVTDDGILYVNTAESKNAKMGTNNARPITPIIQHESTFYGLAKAAGADEKDSTLAFGTYSDNAKSSIQNMLGITDKYSPKEWVAESETELVTNAHNIGDLFYIGETLYKVIADLNAGDAINVGVNVEEVNANDILNDYATKEDVQDNVSIVEKSASGSIASFPDGADGIPLKSLVVDIDPVQDTSNGDPSPENICPISGWTGCEVNATGKNLWNGTLINGDVDIDVKVGITYTISAIASSNAYLYLRRKPIGTSDYTRVGWVLSGTTSGSITFVPEEGYIYSLWSNSTSYSIIENVQIELGSTATAYEPYTGRSIPISWQSEAGTVYGGKLDVLSGVMTVDRYAEDLSQKSWNTRYTGNNYVTLSTSLINAYPRAKGNQIISENYALDSVVGASILSDPDNVNTGLYWYNSATSLTPSVIYVVVNVDTIPSGLVVYPLAEPITIQLTPVQVNSLLGANNIWADTGDTSIEYFSQVDEDLVDYIKANLNSYAKKDLLNNYVDDVQINGTSIVENGIAEIPVASATNKGVVKINSDLGIVITAGGMLMTNLAGKSVIKQGTDAYKPIVSGSAYSAAFYGLAKAAGHDEKDSELPIGTYTDEAKTAIKQMLGVHDTIDSFVEEVTGTDVTITGQPSYRYNCGELYSLTVTPPSSGTIDIRFTSGSTPTVLTLPQTVKMPEWWVEVEANTIYEMCITDGIYCGVMTWAI